MAAIGRDFKSKLIICPKSVDTKSYPEIIQESNMIEMHNQIHGESNWLFMQDGASTHTSRDTIVFLLKRMSLLANWPPNSPDMNPIEHLWAILKYLIKEAQPRSIDNLIKILKDEWANISMGLINALVGSFKKRLLLVSHELGKQIGNLLNSYEEDEIPFDPIPKENTISVVSK